MVALSHKAARLPSPAEVQRQRMSRHVARHQERSWQVRDFAELLGCSKRTAWCRVQELIEAGVLVDKGKAGAPLLRAAPRLTEALLGYRRDEQGRRSVWRVGGMLCHLARPGEAIVRGRAWTVVPSGAVWTPAENCLECAPTGRRPDCGCDDGYRRTGPDEVVP
jgi:biotin operon repressor